MPLYFIGVPNDMCKRYIETIVLVQHIVKTDIFLSMTCNPTWMEIFDELGPHEEAHNCLDLVALVFHAKLEELKI